ncbi:MAG: NADH:flavin oxidoreductase [Desulfobacteraceae bacterium]|nr:MAG: NADH:flavin oxidoreductase [Desulfobacteraceae bacterium]
MSLLFEPFSIKNLTLPNRFVRSATYDGMAEKNGHVSTKQIQMVEELARGGVGLIILGITYVHPSGQISPVQNSLADDACIPGFRMLADTAHRYGSRIAVQLFHAGRETAKVFKPNRKQALAPSSISDDPHFRGPHRAMTEEEILEVIRAFGQAAGRGREAGLDAVQVHGAHAYLLSQFLSPFTNRRTDAWGGELNNRLRLHHEILGAIRSRVGEDYPVLIKIGVQDGFPGGLKFQEGKEAAQFLAQRGYDALEISSGLRGKGYDHSEFKTGISRPEREAYFRDWCREIKPAVKVPVMMVGGLRTPALLEEVIQNGEADLIALSRPLIKEPGLIRDWQQGDRHRATCISCNKCFEALLKGESLRCIYHEETGK